MLNMYEEYAKATLLAQREQTNITTEGRAIQAELGFPFAPQYCGDTTELLPPTMRSQIHMAPIPRHMYPLFHNARRQAHAQKLRNHGTDPDVYSFGTTSGAPCTYTVVASNRGKLVAAATIRTSSVATAETAAIALTIIDVGK
ncbi:hypothetical protein MRX96_017257 [Rhipicephalus microplus]